MSLGSGATDRSHQLDHLVGRNALERMLHAGREAQPQQADFFRWRVHAAAYVGVVDVGTHLSAYSTSRALGINPHRITD
jgi:hypothetical protein